jgi:flagellar hook-associated protein 1 FlgK
MASNILNIGKSALAAAQIGISTTGHNIANASTPGFSRQVIVQAAAESQNFGFGFIGQGTVVASVVRIYNELLAAQAVRSQSSSASANTYLSQMNTVDNMLSNASAGLNPAMSEFFGAVQDLSANPSDLPTRQSMLSFAQSLANRFQSTNNRINEIREGVNTQLTSSINLVNTYAKQIAGLNDVIEKAISASGSMPNDLMDQRDQLVLELSKQIKTTVVSQGQGGYNIYVGNGLPVVVGKDTFNLLTTPSPNDPSRLEVGYQSNNKVTVLGVNSLPGGAIGGLLEFRSESLDKIQNQIGQIAVSFAESYNTQHRLGFDLNGDQGLNLFSIPTPVVNANAFNSGPSSSPANANPAIVAATITNGGLVTASDYRLDYDGTDYRVTRLSDNNVTTSATLPISIDGLSINIASGTILSGDNFLIKPTQNAASLFNLAITDPRKLAIAGTAGGAGDNENGLLLAKLQSDKAVTGNRTFPDAFGQIVNSVGNKTRELKVISASEAQILEQVNAAMQSESGVNLDEEATNLIRYQQAYQAAGKMMQIASQLFDVLLQLGR